MNGNSHTIREVTRAIDDWATNQGLPRKPEHKELAEFIVRRISAQLSPRVSVEQALLLDLDPENPSLYVNPRLIESGCSPEEDLFPEDPETGETVDEAVADVVWYLPHPEQVPCI